MKGEEKVARPASGGSWIKPDAYISALARKRSYRRAREDRRRTQPISPQPWLSTVPFAAILAVLAVLAIAIIFAAFPGSQPVQKPRQQAAREQGVAERGWFQEAQRDMHR